MWWWVLVSTKCTRCYFARCDPSLQRLKLVAIKELAGGTGWGTGPAGTWIWMGHTMGMRQQTLGRRTYTCVPCPGEVTVGRCPKLPALGTYGVRSPYLQPLAPRNYRYGGTHYSRYLSPKTHLSTAQVRCTVCSYWPAPPHSLPPSRFSLLSARQPRVSLLVVVPWSLRSQLTHPSP